MRIGNRSEQGFQSGHATNGLQAHIGLARIHVRPAALPMQHGGQGMPGHVRHIGLAFDTRRAKKTGIEQRLPLGLTGRATQRFRSLRHARRRASQHRQLRVAKLESAISVRGQSPPDAARDETWLTTQ